MPFRNYPEADVEKEYFMRNGNSYMRAQTDPETGNVVLRPERSEPVSRYKDVRRERRERSDYAVLQDENATKSQLKSAKRRIEKREDKAAKYADKNYKKKRIKFNPVLVVLLCMLCFAIIVALANLVLNFFDAKSLIYAQSPNSDAKFGIFAEGYTFALDLDFVLDLDELIHRVADGAILGLAIGFVYGLLSCMIRALADAFRYRRFRRVRHSLEQARYVVCESFARVKDEPADIFYGDKSKNKTGTLFLTKRSLEFYENQYLTPYRNFLVKLDDISVVEAKGLRKVIVYTAKGKYIFRLPIGRALFWRRSILHAIQNGQRANYGR